MPATLATTYDVAGMWRTLEDEELTGVEYLLAFASAIIRNRVPNIDARLADGTLDPILVAGVIASMVVRVAQRPAGVQSESTGPFSVTYANAASGLAITDDELALLTPVGTRRRKVGTIQLGLPSYCEPRWSRW